MKNNDYWFIKRDRNNWKLVAWLCLGTLALVIYVNLKEISGLKREITLLQSSHIHTWIMDESCSKQLLNSDMLRLKLK